jgi:alkaline phosphatase
MKDVSGFGSVWTRCQTTLVAMLLMIFYWSFTIVPAHSQSLGAEQVRIWPTNNSTMLVDQRFDLRVESIFPAETQQEPTLTSIRINGVDFTNSFREGINQQLQLPGGELEIGKPSDSKLFGQTLRNYSFDTPGVYEVEATVNIDGRDVFARNTYKVQRFQTSGNLNRIIFYVGDGMGVPLRTAARIMEYGVKDGQPGGYLQIEQMPELGLVSTHSLNSIIPDSANTAAAWASGTKTVNNAMNAFPDNTPGNPFDNPRAETLPQYMKRKYNWGIGLVTTAFTTDATPGAFGTNIIARAQNPAIAQTYLDFFSDEGYSLPATGYQGWKELAQPVDVILGPGARNYVPQSRIAEFKDTAFRQDGKDLTEVATNLGYSIVKDVNQLNSAPNNRPILGLFLGDFRQGSALGASNIPSELDLLIARGRATIEGRGASQLDPPIPPEFASIPTLAQMHQKAIAVLDQLHPEGWILLVESSQVDKLAHPLDTDRTLYEVLALDEAVGRGREYARRSGNTLLVVTSDHAQGQTVAGTVDSVAIREGRVDLRDAMRSFGNAGFTNYVDADRNGFPDDATPSSKLAIGVSARPVFRTDFLTDDLNRNPATGGDGTQVNPLRDPDGLLLTADLQRITTVANHTADDVAIASEGPGSRLFNGVIDNIEVFQRMGAAISGVRDRNDLAQLLSDVRPTPPIRSIRPVRPVRPVRPLR